MGAKETCHICSSAILTHIMQTRIGFCKLCVVVFCLVASILLGANFSNVAGAGSMEFVLGLTNFM